MLSSTMLSLQAFTLRWSFGTEGSSTHATLSFAVEAHTDIYIADRFWDLTGQSPRFCPNDINRFVDGACLCFLAGDAPRQAGTMVARAYIPYARRIASGETHARRFSFSQPITEWSHRNWDIRCPADLLTLTHAALVLDWCLLHESCSEPEAVFSNDPEALGFRGVFPQRRAVSSMPIEPTHALRRHGDRLARLTLAP